jgi:hypothetical protein
MCYFRVVLSMAQLFVSGGMAKKKDEERAMRSRKKSIGFVLIVRMSIPLLSPATSFLLF